MFADRRIWLAYLVVFISSTCGLVIEMIAGRIMAPYIGVSLYTWTSIIGVVLAGMSLGNFLGGVISDRRASGATLSAIFMAGALSSASILVTTEVMTSAPVASLQLSLLPRIILLTTGIFFLPSLILGMVSPVVIKLALQSLKTTGSTVGSIYAFSTVGSIFGTFVTGFWLISWLGTRTIVWVVVIILLTMGILVGRLWKSRARPAAVAALLVCVVAVWANSSGAYLWTSYVGSDALTFASLFLTVPIPVIVVVGLFIAPQSVLATSTLAVVAMGTVYLGWGAGLYRAPCEVESNYFCIRATEKSRDGHPVRALVLDHLLHSYVSMDDPTVLGYGYEQVYEEITRYYAADHQTLDTLFIGGGGYTFPRYVESVYPQSTVDVLEIDPAVTDFARRRLNLPPDSRIRVFHGDARALLMAWPEPARYDVIYGDAFNDFSVPYHLTTVEFDRMLASHLKHDGIYLANVIDSYQDGEFAKAVLRSLRQVFPHVYLLAFSSDWRTSSRYTFVAMASRKPFDQARFGEVLRAKGTSATVVVSATELESYLSSGRALTLTDDFVPVDQLLAPLFAREK